MSKKIVFKMTDGIIYQGQCLLETDSRLVIGNAKTLCESPTISSLSKLDRLTKTSETIQVEVNRKHILWHYKIEE